MDLLNRFFSTLLPTDATAAAVRNYANWQIKHRLVDFVPSEDDDVDLRTYFHHLYTNGADLARLQEHAEALKRFYQWAQTEGVITGNPFEYYDFIDSSLLDGLPDPAVKAHSGDLNMLDLEKLRALNQIDEQLISSLDIQSALDNSLRVLVKETHIQTGWVSLLSDSHLSVIPIENPPPHGFYLAAAHGLPPGLEKDGRRFLRQPPACRCQQLLKEGRLTRAVNIVECTRLKDSMEAAGDTQGLRFHASAPLISNGKPLGLINIAATGWQNVTGQDLNFLSAVATRLSAAIERAHFYEVAENRRILLENELQIARDVQEGLMPDEIPEIPGFGLAFAWSPAREMAGDFYNVFRMDDERWGIIIGDVADKGTAAALYMAMIQSLVLSSALRLRDPGAILEEVNKVIGRQSSALTFISVFFGLLNPKKSTLRYVNAGHNPPLVRRSTGEVERLSKTGPVLGVFDELQIKEERISLFSGDSVVLYTDGVTEAWHWNPQDEDYGVERLTAALVSAPPKAGPMLAHIEADLKGFTGNAPPQDDVTIMVLTCD